MYSPVYHKLNKLINVKPAWQGQDRSEKTLAKHRYCY